MVAGTSSGTGDRPCSKPGTENGRGERLTKVNSFPFAFAKTGKHHTAFKGTQPMPPQEVFSVLLKDVRCSILSVTKTGKQEAYVFNYSGFDSFESFFYSHKNFASSHQGYPHRNFQKEIQFLNAVFPNGAAYYMGRMNSDCWYLYTLDFPESRVISQPDQTLEILMSELDPAVMDQFYMKDDVTAKDVTLENGICELMPGSVIDATMFNPCGHSMNGMKSDGTYWTIHITPEPEFSYVSFETNLSQTSCDDLIRKVVGCGLGA
ncbi:PREDICTED: S-adenosylmethionine decarboxylase proenzyme-like [Myotis davidii]|uniref:S-adenosylmethionine decarboxylase proenzyme-like n=1 Tax=Myotis davidii TaxID=225400 RepID=UPI0003EC26E2|nr:PREDICTED: S-adenosylmethionine decarboxylase proenzyme-like [Myotis davidii]